MLKILIIIQLFFLPISYIYSSSGYIGGDFHQHTTYTDGSYSFGYLMDRSNSFGLDWWANSEHGGAFNRWGLVSGLDVGSTVNWGVTSLPLLGSRNASDSTAMWRWQSLRDWAFRDMLLWRRVFPEKLIVQGLELNVPGFEHASVSILPSQFASVNPNVNALAEFEYKFDNYDGDTSESNGWLKSTNVGRTKALEAAAWLQNHYQDSSWMIVAHPERISAWKIQDIRDLNNVAPNVFFGFESIPGHQKYSNRGGYSFLYGSYGSCTYGGAGWMCAKVGGFWDALLSEGRRYWLFANSDFHDASTDFFPGEYLKNYTFVAEKHNPKALVDGLRSGNSYVVMGDLIDSLDVKIGGVSLGGVLETTKDSVLLSIRVHDPLTANFNSYNDYRFPELDHLDVIVGSISDLISPLDTLEYTKDSVSTTHVLSRFGKDVNYVDSLGLVTRAWSDDGDGWRSMNLSISVPSGARMYLRLRGTNKKISESGETDGCGNPLMDVVGMNSPSLAFLDLWFYSNPIFLEHTMYTTLKKVVEPGFIVTKDEASGVLNMKFPMFSVGEVELLNTSGRRIMVKLHNGETSEAFFVKGLPRGVYFVRFKEECQKVVL